MWIICSLTEIEGIWIYWDDDVCRWKVLNPALIRKYSKWWKPDTKNRDVGLKRREECSWLACSHRRTALRIKDSRGAEPETWLDSEMFGTNLTFYWLKDRMIWLRLLCIWRLWLYESCSFQYKTQWGHWPTSPTCPCGVWESQEVPLFDAMWFEDDALFCIFVCFFLAMHKFFSWDECGLCMAIDSPWLFTMLQAVQSSSKDTSASHSRLMHEQQRSSRKQHFVEICWVIFFEDPSLQTPFRGLFVEQGMEQVKLN